MPNYYPAPETLSPDNFAPILTRLKLLLDNLPNALPSHGNKSEKFGVFLTQPENFVLDADWMEKTECEVATLSEMLKTVFGWSARTTGDGVVEFEERGPAVSAMHDVLSRFWPGNDRRYENNNVLKKWIIDIAIGAEKCYTTYNTPVWISPSSLID
jgi:hypothetical protein